MHDAKRQGLPDTTAEDVWSHGEIARLLSAGLRTIDPLVRALAAAADAFDFKLVAVGRPHHGRLEVLAVWPAEARTLALESMESFEATRAIETSRVHSEKIEGREPRRIWASIRDGDGVLGVLVVHSSSTASMHRDDEKTCTVLASQLTDALRNQELVDGLRARAEKLERGIQERTVTLERQIRFTGQIIDSLPVSLYVVDRARTIVAWNKQRELGDRGLLREQVIGRSLFEVFDLQPCEAIDEELRPVFERGETLRFERDSMVGGELRHYRVRKLPMRLEPGEVTHVLTIGEDITEQRRMEKSMVVTEKMAAMGRLAAGVAHEINNPLATIVTCAEGLETRLKDLALDASVASEFEEYLQIITQEAYRAKRITEDLLDFSRVRPSQRRVQSLDKILDRTLLILKHHAGFKRAEVERRFEENVPCVAVEEEGIVQALVALIINALDAMPDGGTLGLTTSTQDDEVRCEVRDTGCGIQPSDLAQIFEPFYTTKPPGRGTGLGLAVCYGIVKAHGGRIEVDSKSGEGSRFTVVLPATRANVNESEENH